MNHTTGPDGPGTPQLTDAMLREEFLHLFGSENPPDDDRVDARRSALCLSGGGIRSATFCLGVLQWLAVHDQLKSFHYLSTVSGGGYIGSWLVNALTQARRQEVQGGDGAAAWLARFARSAGSLEREESEPAASAGRRGLPEDDKDPVAPLRNSSNYLSPTGGLSGDAFSLAAIFVRNLLLNALVWLPLLAVAVAVPRLYIAVLEVCSRADGSGQAWAWGMVGLSFMLIVGGVVYIVTDLPAPARPSIVPSNPTEEEHLEANAQAAVGEPRWKNHFYLACFWPITLAAVGLSLAGAWLADLRNANAWAFAGAGALAHFLGVALGVWVRVRWRCHPARSHSIPGLLAVVVAGAVGGALACLALSQLGQGAQGEETSELQRLLYASLSVPAMTSAFWLAMALYAGLLGRITDEQDREWWARATAAWLKASLYWSLAAGLVVWAPLWLLSQFGGREVSALEVGAGGGLLGILTSAMGYWSKNGDAVRRKTQGVLRMAGVRVLEALAGLVVVAIVLSLSLAWGHIIERCHAWPLGSTLCSAELAGQTQYLRDQAAYTRLLGEPAREAAESVLDTVPSPQPAAAQVFQHVLVHTNPWPLLLVLAMLAGWSTFLAWRMGANHFSLHGMYGNRLVRAYLGSGRKTRKPHWFTGFDADDNPELHTLGAPLLGDDRRPRLYPVINMALNLVKPTPAHLDWQTRKAAPFVATPLHCGAPNTGYRPTREYAQSMTLGRALTISGAAASPNMGYHSSPMVTFVMTLFNVRLGWWLPNPGAAGGEVWRKDQPTRPLRFLMDEAAGATTDTGPFVHLSDGGHFDNTGIYEMVRRGCRRIVAIDCTCDGEFKWHDLLDVVRKIRVDLGVPIELPAILPGAGRESRNPRWVEAPIRYTARGSTVAAKDGTLIVLKPRLMPDRDPPELSAYADADAPDSGPDDPGRFPHQSTADQFYDEQQFESYRLLGYVVASEALGQRAGSPGPWRGKPGALRTVRPLAAAKVGERGEVLQKADELAQRLTSGASGARGLEQLVQQMGSGAALASALAVGGTVGVAGTVALQPPPEVQLSAADRELLVRGLSVRASAGEVRLNPEDKDWLSKGVPLKIDSTPLAQSLEQLNEAARALGTAAGNLKGVHMTTEVRDLRGSAADAKALHDAIKELPGKIASLASAVGPAPGKSQEAGVNLAVAVNRLNDTLQRIEALEPKDKGLGKAVEDLKNAIERVAPRRSVRGQDGGQP